MDDGTTPIEELTLADWRRQVADLYVEVRRRLASDPDGALALWRETRERLYREHSQSPVMPDARPTFRAQHFTTDPTLRFEVVVEPDDDGAPAADAATPFRPPVTDLPATTIALDLASGAAATLSQAVPPPLLPPTEYLDPASVETPAFSFAAPLLQLPVSAGGAMSFRRIGFVTVPFPAGTRRLAVFWMEGYAGGLFLPFRDATNGRETYGAGRYLFDAAKSADLGGDTAAGTLRLDFNFAYQPSCAFDPKWACPLAPPENRLDIEVRAGERIA
jgi:uncharacterized protein (DUF1684 family)